MTWRDVDQLWGKAHFVGVSRPGHELTDFGLSEEVSLMQIPAMAISSTDCRERVEQGKPVWYLVPDGVVQYIGKYGLYVDHNGKVSHDAVKRHAPVSLNNRPEEADE